MSPIAILVEYHIKPELRADFEQAVKQDAAATLQDDGCLRFEVQVVQNDPNCFILNELWRDAAAIEAHRNKPGHTHEHLERMAVGKRVTRCTVIA